MTDALLDVPTFSRGFCEVTPAACEAGRAAAAAAGDALAAVLGCAVVVRARAVAGVATSSRAHAQVAVTLDAVASHAVLEVETSLLAATLAALASGAPPPAALCATPVEQSFFELLALVAIDGCRATAVDALAPRLVGSAPSPAGALVIALDLAVGDRRGAGRLFAPPAALRALAGAPRLCAAAEAAAIGASFREGTALLSEEELASLEPGDAVLVTPGAAAIVLPGGLCAHGALVDGVLHVEEIRMNETQAAFPITVSVEIGRVTLTLGELARLEPGAALPLDLRRDGRAILRAGERALAHGRLVDVDGALAMQVDGLGERP